MFLEVLVDWQAGLLTIKNIYAAEAQNLSINEDIESGKGSYFTIMLLP
jgi:hypothetical protein